MPYATLFWLGATVVLLIVEGLTVSLVSIWFAIGAVAALLVSLATPSLPLQGLVFAAVSFAALLLTKPLVAKLRSRPVVPTNGDRNIGRTAIVLEPIVPGAPGRVRLDGVDWAAECAAHAAAGQAVRVTAIRSTTLIVEPLPLSETSAAH